MTTSCPRCGYDLRGVCATWRDAWPLEATCAECGLTFRWAELLSRRLVVPRWCVESKGRWLTYPGQVVQTFFRSFWPWSFWSGLRMTHPSRCTRLAVYGTLLLVLVYGAFSVSHAVRAWGNWLQGGWTAAATTSTTHWPVVLQAAGLPLSNRSIGTFTLGGGGWAYDTPWELVTTYCQGLFVGLLMLVGMHVCCGVAFAALPITRRRCKVRWSHIARVTVYGLALLLPVLCLLNLWHGLEFTGNSRFAVAIAVMRLLVALAWLMILPLELCWWSVATSRYLRMPHAWAVGVSVVAIGVLTAPAVFVLLSLAFE